MGRGAGRVTTPCSPHATLCAMLGRAKMVAPVSAPSARLGDAPVHPSVHRMRAFRRSASLHTRCQRHAGTPILALGRGAGMLQFSHFESLGRSTRWLARWPPLASGVRCECSRPCLRECPGCDLLSGR